MDEHNRILLLGEPQRLAERTACAVDPKDLT
jgi:hypothetical protein